jgi:hypothetical protein
MQEKEIRVVMRIEGGLADDGILDIYDAANIRAEKHFGYVCIMQSKTFRKTG